jgi:hypothetical protein
MKKMKYLVSVSNYVRPALKSSRAPAWFEAGKFDVNQTYTIYLDPDVKLGETTVKHQRFISDMASECQNADCHRLGRSPSLRNDT